MCPRSVLYLLILIFAADSARVRHHSPTGKQALKFLKGIGVHNKKVTSANGGLWPSVFNLATKALISSNATCGEGGRDEFCRMSEGSKGRCGVCDNFSPDPGKRHPINYAIDDGTNRWWQSPPIYSGPQYEYVTVTLDLKQVYQVAYVIIKAANSPRPGAWILERSTDGVNYDAWQYFATSDKDCTDRYGIPARKGKPHYFTDSEVICTSFYSKLMPMENGEIHTFLIHGRPGANETSPELLQFTKARYVRLRLQGFRGSVEPLPAWLSQDIARDKRLYYSIRDISIGGQCVCNGHASSCRHNVASGHPECECAHHTCGANCDRCCPLHNQRHWGPGTSRDARICLPCNCHGHSTTCHYDEDVDRSGLSLDINGYYQGGGVCDNCTSHTTGINCEKCAAGFYRPPGTKPDAETPCSRCDCDEVGSTGHCALQQDGLRCECRRGYTGPRCDSCEEGHRGYPECEPCPCDPRGAVNEDCEGECTCKTNANGKYCDHCKTGFFSLQSANPDGCSACFCSGATTVCASAHLPQRMIQAGSGWLISDITVTEIEEPTLDERNMISVGNYEIPGIEAYYWLAPEVYLGNKLEAYGAELIYKVHWVVMRGDTSGKPTSGPNIILVGANGMRIACGDDTFGGTNMTFKIILAEYEGFWYHVPDDVKDIVTRLRRTEYKGEIVTRQQFLSVLTNIKHILLRAKFHTDQIEGSLEEVAIHTGDFKEGYSPVEECSCPSGYTGLSCESCQYGYVRIMSNTTSHEELGFCVKCDCNGHSSTCNAETGECFCEHSTIGETCERCAVGYYGNPLLGTVGDCKKCACPLEEDENNFSQSCQLDSSSVSNDDDEPGYVCTQCPKGYTGDHCEICDDGYFGIPSTLGGKCEPCTCGGGPCDRITGQCLGCRGNTEGWRCERCKGGYYGDPVIGCNACLCDSLGSVKPECNNATGDCECREHFIGRTCNRCEDGYGNVTAQCTRCSCNEIGSKSNVCDPHSGLCECRPGVEGFHCDACQHLHYGFGDAGCQSCKCNPKGSEISTCDIVTGQCRCKAFYVGRSCDNCEEGFWDTHAGCTKCDCDADGSQSQNCDRNTGDCACKPGVDGAKCGSCKPNYYGFSTSGCKQCDVCNKKGHICDPDTGRCVCPPNSHGEVCSKCKVNTWGYEPDKGCKACNCSETGSIKSQCNIRTGVCFCQQGYTGHKCEKCEHGYYGYPKCRRCSCNFAGTDIDLGRCDSGGICQCNNEGMCPCKMNVNGKRCNHCKDGTFGLHEENPHGCTQCFCFGRSTICSEAGYTWTKIRARNRSLSIDFIDGYNKFPKVISNDIIDSSNFEEIDQSPNDITKSHDHFEIPLYWKLPNEFNGDRVLSYGGYLRFATNAAGAKNGIFSQFPLVSVEGNGVKLIYEPPVSHTSSRHEIRLHESLWRCLHTNKNEVSRDLLMITLQNVTGVYIKGTDYSMFEKIVLTDVSLDTAAEVSGSPPPLAMGVEKCQCPEEYAGTSCQNPSLGYHREKATHPAVTAVEIDSKLIDAVIGKSVRCECNNRSSVCDIESGECMNCTENTAGKSCEHCAEGYYGDPMKPNGQCQACACPSVTHNFAVSCTPNPRSNYFICKCKKGYFGPTCDRCSPGYYGQPHLPGGSCQPCNCNKDGRINYECDQLTGNCNCKKGITGAKCSQCEKSRHILENNTCIPCDSCIQILLDDIDTMSENLSHNTHHLQNGTIQPPWEKLTATEQRFIKLSSDFDNYIDTRDRLTDLIDKNEISIFENDVAMLKDTLTESKENEKAIAVKSAENAARGEKLSHQLHLTKQELKRIIKSLQDFGNSHISTKEAIKKGERILKEIKEIDVKVQALPKGDNVAERCKKIHATIKQLVSKLHSDPEDVRRDLNALIDRLIDMETILNNIRVKNQHTASLNDDNEALYDKNRAKLERIEREKVELEGALADQKLKVEETYAWLNKMEENYDQFVEMRDELNNLMKWMEEKEMMYDEGIDTLEDYKGQIDQHVDELERNVTEYKSIFKLTTKEADTVKASERFKEIISIINEANTTAITAKANFDEIVATTLRPEGKDNIYDNSSIAIADSDRLLTRVTNLQNQLPASGNRLNKLYSQMEDVKSKNWKNGLRNNAHSEKINQELHSLKTNVNGTREIENMIKTAADHSDQMRKIYKDAANINISMQYGLVKDYRKYLNLTSTTNIKALKENVKVTKELLQNITFFGEQTNLDIIKNMNKAFDTFKLKRDSLEKKIMDLKNTIRKAEQIAASIKVAMTGPTCSRSFKIPDLEPTTFFKINILLTCNNTDGGLFLLHNSNQYLNLKIENQKVILRWKFHKEEYTIESVYELEADDDVFISVRRINNEMALIVNKFNNSVNMNEPLTFFNVTEYNLLRVGADLNNKIIGLPGCLKEMDFNDHPVRLWEFEKSDGVCVGCHKNNTILAFDTYRYNGEGYISNNDSKDMRPERINVEFTMRTFDENAILFLAYFNGSYMAIKLRDRMLYCEVHYNDAAVKPLIVESKRFYNDGEKVHVECSKEYSNGMDRVRFLINRQKVTDSDVMQSIGRANVLKIKKATLYYGGVPPDFADAEFKNQSFMGLLSKITSSGKPLSLQNGHFYGVEYHTEDHVSYRKVLFDTSGYLKLKNSVHKVHDIKFIVRTTAENGMLLHLGSVSIKLQNGAVVVDQNSSPLLRSSKKINDDEYYLVHFDKTKASLFINGIKEEEDGKKSTGGIDDTDLFIGGVENQPNEFSGLIKDIFLNDKLVYINSDTYQDAMGAKVGRSKPSRRPASLLKEVEEEVDSQDDLKLLDNDSMKDMQQSDGCDKINYLLEPNAVKFGDAPDSYVQHILKDSFWKSDFNIDFEFRTFYKDGLIFVAHGPKDHYNLLQIKNGRIELHIKGKRTKKIASTLKIDDGNWHHISIQCSVKHKRRLSVTIDGDLTKMKIPQNRVSGKLFFGDLPKTERFIPLVMNPFRGCIRSLKINNAPQSLINNKNTMHHNIGQCFPNIEKGSYFRGDSYAVYSNYFKLSNYLELSFDFRTSEQNGIFLSISNIDNSPALSLELQNGAVVMSVDMGGGGVTNVTNYLSKYTICNNKWHHVRATFSTELTVKVDGVSQSWVLSDIGLLEQIEAPLYIGGLPDSAPGGTLKIRENFKGCIHNLTIGNQELDWISMDELNNVSLNSCPVIL